MQTSRQITGTTTLTLTYTPQSTKTTKRPTSRSCRAYRPCTRQASYVMRPLDTTQKTCSIPTSVHIHTCYSSQYPSSLGLRIQHTCPSAALMTRTVEDEVPRWRCLMRSVREIE